MIELTLEMAERAARGAQRKARDLGISMTVSVVDEAGRLVLCMRGDGTGFLTTETSCAKAVAAVSFKKSTKELVRLRESNMAFWSSLPSVTSLPVLPTTGGVPLFREGKVIGAIGCGGGSPDQDDECATAGSAEVSS